VNCTSVVPPTWGVNGAMPLLLDGRGNIHDHVLASLQVTNRHELLHCRHCSLLVGHEHNCREVLALVLLTMRVTQGADSAATLTCAFPATCTTVLLQREAMFTDGTQSRLCRCY
jgi:hypothetical protein